MTLDSYRSHVRPIIDPVVRLCIAIRLSPDRCTILSFIGAVCAGITYYYGMVIAATLFVMVNAVFDALDGAIARTMGLEGPRGDLLDHTLDRYADIIILSGIFAGSLCPWWIGVFGLTGVIMASYIGTQAQAIGVGRVYGGILGRADRLVLLMAAGVFAVLIPSGLSGLPVFAWLLLLFGFLGHFTAIQRFWYVWRQIE
ncbi:MAG: CDP-alcohol phosphatidyltransferase family protein [Methanospirillaceae archaeon]|nr:CDP-alcohol phosphatidyltransferase family protein [Methanospirillaceae archaeon]